MDIYIFSVVVIILLPVAIFIIIIVIIIEKTFTTAQNLLQINTHKHTFIVIVLNVINYIVYIFI